MMVKYRLCVMNKALSLYAALFRIISRPPKIII